MRQSTLDYLRKHNVGSSTSVKTEDGVRFKLTGTSASDTVEGLAKLASANIVDVSFTGPRIQVGTMTKQDRFVATAEQTADLIREVGTPVPSGKRPKKGETVPASDNGQPVS